MIHARRRVLATCMSGIAGVVLLAGCGGSAGDPAAHGTPGDPSTPGGSSSAVATTPTTPISGAADPGHAVAAPGRWDGKLPGDDLLVVSDKTLSDDLLAKFKAIRIGKGKDATPGVAVTARLSFGQFSTQEKVLNIAAVDPATYRDFTGATSARWQEQWDRIAGGEIAVVQKWKDALPLDANGYLEVGSGDKTQDIHVGAWSPSTVDGIDAMVNTKWGDSLGLPTDNALLVNTGFASPDDVRTAMRKIDPDLSITALDAVQQFGIDPNTFSTVIPVGSFSQAVGVYHYTALGGGRVAPDPAWVRAHIATEVMPIIGPMTCNKAIFPQLQAALIEIQKVGLADKITNYAGCYVPRFIAGSTTLSNHAFGLAFDIDPADNARGTVGQIDRGVVAIFQKWGFTWGGTWRYTDPMHFELNRIVRPGG
jgi:hypothetical protein